MSERTSAGSIRVPAALLDRFDRLAEATERTRSYHVIKALEAYIAEQEYLSTFVGEAVAEADSDPTALTNAEAIAEAIAKGLLQPEGLAGPDPVSDEDYEAAQQSPAWT